MTFFKKAHEPSKELANKIQNTLEKIKIDFGGGCSLEKAIVLGWLIWYFKIPRSIDIGVYRGRSFFPQAIAHKQFTKGKVIGIDPYSNVEAIQNDRKDLENELLHFAKNTNFEEIFTSVSDLSNQQLLTEYSELCRMTSDEAFKRLSQNKEKYGLIHIDGNHDSLRAYNDIKNYYTLLSDKSVMIIDDVSWETLNEGSSWIEKEMTFIAKYNDKRNDFSVYAKGISDNEFSTISKNIEKIMYKYQTCH